jgi:hypothetical protein
MRAEWNRMWSRKDDNIATSTLIRREIQDCSRFVFLLWSVPECTLRSLLRFAGPLSRTTKEVVRFV